MARPKKNMNLNEYVNNKELLKELLISKKQNKLTDRALYLLMLMVNKCSKSFEYKYPEDREDCISSAYLDILLYWDRFNEEKGQLPFAYYSSIIFNGICKGFNKIHPVKTSKVVSIDINEGIYNI